ncbi:hypothetical protein F441_11291 [Phytophthora nicotianae CJ01A1]|uniref:Uncharacterized protein n=5 Tax=Phytophthora nicotianae TaxID=4792 RepID=W2Q426_PHYN3|nr:hypothetical protein PPTG_23213 [Phytophthora nicotianae INRA-310]ETI43776.1 hypothetical protein F443_11374 [Phytophthora nicotianae P1569]ETO72452.1 hypothetical protein F444_11444 [Phytophthora nicotianae P1976]ETP13587.1 hypothetical protein F441_11291 [Phytophthora nicotianae CJ01A1]ETP41650.1 hypothetical protein F442_11259 [Phytophthora nicotianae P10297]ETN07020.1 hypothetical protein PPTG_23213 [Phytophthora nicotianae INRA-310]
MVASGALGLSRSAPAAALTSVHLPYEDQNWTVYAGERANAASVLLAGVPPRKQTTTLLTLDDP